MTRDNAATERPGANGRIAWATRGMILCLLLTGLACGVTDERELPPEVVDPATQQTPAGAVARYQGSLNVFPPLFDKWMTLTGILTDELASLPAPLGVTRSPYTAIDSRRGLADNTAMKELYSGLHRLRGQVREARGFVEAFAPDSSPALAGHLYALEGYAEVLLAELFCSGIPLSTVDFDGDYTLVAGSSTADVYRHAVALFDSALALVGDSARFQPFTAVGQGRALLALGRYAEAAAAVAAVPDGYQYQVVYTPQTAAGEEPERLLQRFGNSSNASTATGYRRIPATPSMGDNEGINGLPYRSDADPRTPARVLPGTDPFGNTMYLPAKYPVSGAVTLTVADGVEARLIEAEADLQAGGGTWLATLNALRTDGTFSVDTQVVGVDTTVDSTVTPPDTTYDTTFAYDTLWHAGSGGVDGLEPLADPGTDAGRVDLLFRERAFWLYLTGHRQGDLRRLVREYFRSATSVYPTGLYQGGLEATYGSEVVAPVPEEERDFNDLYTGCIHVSA